MRRIFSKEKEGSLSLMNETNTNNEKVSNNPLVQYERKDKKTLDFTNEYNKYIRWKKKVGKNNSLKTFCTENSLNYKDMTAWLRINRPISHSSNNTNC